MTVEEAVKENIAAMRAAGLDIRDSKTSEIEQFGGLVVLSKQSRKGRRGRVFTLFETSAGQVGFWPLASCGPRLGFFTRTAREK